MLTTRFIEGRKLLTPEEFAALKVGDRVEACPFYYKTSIHPNEGLIFIFQLTEVPGEFGATAWGRKIADNKEAPRPISRFDIMRVVKGNGHIL